MSKTILIDVGHGGSDSGAIGFGVKEKEWNLKQGLAVYNRLKELGVNVSINRTSDVTIEPNERTRQIANNYDYCISLHFNASNGKARGIETIYSIKHGSGFASILADELVKATGLPLRRVFSKKNDLGTDWYFMLRLTDNTHTVIIESGFIDNRTDHNWYRNNKNFNKAVEAIVKGVCRQVGVAYRSSSQKVEPNKKGGNTLYKVQTGAFKDINNAESLAKKLEKDGYDTYIVYDGLAPAPQEKRKSVEEYADIIERTSVIGVANRAKYLGLTLDEYKPVQQELDRRYK